jgi:hypothetical protein
MLILLIRLQLWSFLYNGASAFLSESCSNVDFGFRVAVRIGNCSGSRHGLKSVPILRGEKRQLLKQDSMRYSYLTLKFKFQKGCSSELESSLRATDLSELFVMCHLLITMLSIRGELVAKRQI